MNRRSNYGKPPTIDVQGVLGNFKVPDANLTVEYVLTYVPLDGGQTENGQLLELLVPVREAFDLRDLDFDQLLQRDLDDFRVSEEMIPYILGKTSSDPRFFPPIVAVIVPMAGKHIAELYPQCIEKYEEDQEIRLKVFNYGDVFSVKQEERPDGQLAQSPVDLCIHQTNAKLVIVDGQHRAMAMLATYRSALNRWKGNPFQHFYQEVTLDIADLRQIHLPVCIAYFPELTESKQKPTEKHLTRACRKVFLDVNRSARHPSEARQILLDDTDLVACFTRHLFNMVKNNKKTSSLQLHHTEYDNPRDRVSIIRPFALTDVYALFSIVRSVLLLNDERVRNPMSSSSSGRPPQNNLRLQRELDLENALTEEDKTHLGIEIADIRQNNYPRISEQKLRECFEETWGQTIINSLTKLYPFSVHIEAVEIALKENDPYIGVDQIAHTALVEGQGLRHTLNQQQQRDREIRQSREDSNAQRAWKALRKIEEDFEKHRARLYLKLNQDPTPEEIQKVNRLFACFRSSAFQNGLFMAFAYLKDKMDLDDIQKFVTYVDKWIKRINNKFQNIEGVKTTLFDHSNSKSLRYVYKPTGGLTPSDWPFFRYLILELLSVKRGIESTTINIAKTGWRGKLYTILYNRKVREIGELEDEDTNNGSRLDLLTYGELANAFESSLAVDEEEIKPDLSDSRKGGPQPVSENEVEEETEDSPDL